MKHTDFWQRIQEIKAQELRELKNALEKVGGSYEWEDLFEAPLITLHIGGVKNEYMIKKIKLGDCCLATVVKYVDERVILENQAVFTSNVEVGDLSNITELLPGDEDVSERQEDFVVVTVSREDLKEKGFDADSLDGSTMQSIAKRMGNAYLDEQYWLDMEIVAEEGLGLRRIWDVWFDNVDLVDLAKFLVEARGINFERPSDTDEGCHEFVEAVYHWWSLLANWQKEQIYYEYKNKYLNLKIKNTKTMKCENLKRGLDAINRQAVQNLAEALKAMKKFDVCEYEWSVEDIVNGKSPTVLRWWSKYDDKVIMQQVTVVSVHLNEDGCIGIWYVPKQDLDDVGDQYSDFMDPCGIDDLIPGEAIKILECLPDSDACPPELQPDFYVLFGLEPSTSYRNGDLDEIPGQLAKSDGAIKHCVFSTKAERDAYEDGMCDMDGWLDYVEISAEEYEQIFGEFTKLKNNEE